MKNSWIRAAVTAALAAAMLAIPASAQVSIPSLPPCTSMGQSVSLNLSTTTSATIDPQWLVSAMSLTPSPTAATASAHHVKPTYPGPWTSLPNWIQPYPSQQAQPSDAGYYTYQIQFNIPCPKASYGSLAISGRYWADDEVTAFLVNGNAVSSTPPCSDPCYTSPVGAPIYVPSSSLVTGTNTLTIVVKNKTTYTALAVKATLNGTCHEACGHPRIGYLKICKVAGPGVAVGMPFHFTMTPGGATSTVQAGPAPGGTCWFGGEFPIGTNVTVQETVPSGYGVSNITSVPNGTYDLNAGTANLTIGSGISEVTYTNEARVGYLEICKITLVPGGPYTFTVNQSGIGPIVVPNVGCSPPTQVNAGLVTITETGYPSGTYLYSCGAWQGGTIPCSVSGQAATLTVAPGNIAAQTIVFMVNAQVIVPPGGSPPRMDRDALQKMLKEKGVPLSLK